MVRKVSRKEGRTIITTATVNIFCLSMSTCDLAAGWFGGAAGVVAGHPMDTIKVRQQADVAAAGHTEKGRHSSDRW